jgi:hypothetical protein
MPRDDRSHLSKRFPYLEKAIDDKFDRSEEFRALCRDYVDAVDALTHWEDKEKLTAKTRDRIIEYRHLVENLESEILLELYRSSSS